MTDKQEALDICLHDFVVLIMYIVQLPLLLLNGSFHFSSSFFIDDESISIIYAVCFSLTAKKREQKRRIDDWEWYSMKTMMMMMWLYSKHIIQTDWRIFELNFSRVFTNTTYLFLFKVLGKHTLLIIIIIIIKLFSSSSSLIFTHVRINWNSLRFPCVYFE